MNAILRKASFVLATLFLVCAILGASQSVFAQAPAPTAQPSGERVNDLTPIYQDGALVYPLFPGDKSLGEPVVVSVSTLAASAAEGCLPIAQIDPETWGDLDEQSQLARAATGFCDGKLYAQAWSVWAGRPRIFDGHEGQTLRGHWSVTDLTTDEVVWSENFKVENVPSTDGVLSFNAEYIVPADGHKYEISITVRVRQAICGNGWTGDVESSAQGSVEAPKPEPSIHKTWISLVYNQLPTPEPKKIWVYVAAWGDPHVWYGQLPEDATPWWQPRPKKSWLATWAIGWHQALFANGVLVEFEIKALKSGAKIISNVNIDGIAVGKEDVTIDKGGVVVLSKTEKCGSSICYAPQVFWREDVNATGLLPIVVRDIRLAIAAGQFK